MRFKLVVVAVVAIAGTLIWYLTRSTSVPTPRPPVEIAPVGTIAAIAPNLYVIPGGGCNTIVFVTEDGVLLVDTKYAESWDALRTQVASVTDKPITHVVNTHRHSDHSQGNSRLPDGVHVVVHASVGDAFKSMAPPQDATASGTWLGTSPITFDQRYTLFDGNDAVDLFHFGPAHTAGDTFVVFRSARVMAVGDVMPAKALPSIVIEGGGNGATFAGVVARAAELPGVDRVITGHGPVLPRQDFEDYVELHRLFLEHVRTTMHIGVDKNAAFRSLRLPDKFKAFDLRRSFNTMDEIDRSLRPWWQRVW